MLNQYMENIMIDAQACQRHKQRTVYTSTGKLVWETYKAIHEGSVLVNTTR